MITQAKLKEWYGWGKDAYKYKLPIEFPVYGQCIAFDERICSKVSEFLRSKGVFAHTHTWID